MRMITNGELPNATKVNGKWAIPVTDLGAAGLSPGQPKSPDQPTVQTTNQNTDQPITTDSQMIILRAQLETERTRRISAEQLADERLARVEDLRRALNDLRQALPIGNSDTSNPVETDHQPETHEHPTINDASSKQPSFWRRIFSQ